MNDCPKCRGRMTQGYLFLPDTGGRVKWLDGVPGFWKSMMGIGAKPAELTCSRCGQCGFIEFYVDTTAKPIKTLQSIDEENERLRNLVTKLQERVANLETIATDPAEQTSRAIEQLRFLPDHRSDETDPKAPD